MKLLLSKNMITGYTIDLMTLICTLKDIPTTFEKPIWKTVKTFPSGYKPIHIVADTYPDTSIKSSERGK